MTKRLVNFDLQPTPTLGPQPAPQENIQPAAYPTGYHIDTQPAACLPSYLIPKRTDCSSIQSSSLFTINHWNIYLYQDHDTLCRVCSLTLSILDILYTQVSGSWIFYQTKQGLPIRQPLLGLVKVSRTTDLRLGFLVICDQIDRLKTTMNIFIILLCLARNLAFRDERDNIRFICPSNKSVSFYSTLSAF
jgi:hypothetical protein